MKQQQQDIERLSAELAQWEVAKMKERISELEVENKDLLECRKNDTDSVHSHSLQERLRELEVQLNSVFEQKRKADRRIQAYSDEVDLLQQGTLINEMKYQFIYMTNYYINITNTT